MSGEKTDQHTTNHHPSAVDNEAQEVQQTQELPKEEEQTVSEEQSGWLAMRSWLPHRWERRWISVKSGQLHFGKTAEHLSKCIDLSGAQVAESGIDRKKFAFRVKPKEQKRIYYLNAENEESRSQWMQVICYATAVKDGSHSQACIIQ